MKQKRNVRFIVAGAQAPAAAFVLSEPTIPGGEWVVRAAIPNISVPLVSTRARSLERALAALAGWRLPPSSAKDALQALALSPADIERALESVGLVAWEVPSSLLARE